MSSLLRMRRPVLEVLVVFGWASGALSAQPDLDAFVATYRRQPVENPWHEGRITRAEHGLLRWTNQAGVSWTLRFEATTDRLLTGPGNPYLKNGLTAFEVLRSGDGLQGFRFGDDTYVREGVTLLAQQGGGLKGYISAYLDDVPEGHGHGVSFYVAVWSLLERPLAGFQIGLPSTWIIPDNRGFTQPLCPPGTVARDNWPERGPTWDSVFQTIEGGLGFWVSTRYPSAIPKYRINGTPNGYNHEISSPGWGFGRIAALAAEEIGIAQLSNLLLVPPDGLTFRRDTTGGLLGNAWMALPLVPAQVIDGTPTGDQSWTLFLSTKTFRGPVAFWLPETWSRLSRRYATIHGRGLDARPGRMNGGAMEINTVPYFTGTDRDGVFYSRIPRIRFPVDAGGRTVLMQDVRLYSEETLHDAIANWLSKRGSSSGRFAAAGTARPKLRARALSLRQGPDDLPMQGFETLVETAIYEQSGSQAFGLEWRQPAASTGQQSGQLPEYWRRDGNRLLPVAAANVPAETRLREQAFAEPSRFPAYEQAADAAVDWRVADKRHGPFTVDLSDGSRVTYAWFRFLDQPVLRGNRWSEATRRNLQELVDAMHRSWPIDGTYLPDPSAGTLAELDPALLVVPPKGCEVGYVPIALGQSKPGGR